MIGDGRGPEPVGNPGRVSRGGDHHPMTHRPHATRGHHHWRTPVEPLTGRCGTSRGTPLSRCIEWYVCLFAFVCPHLIPRGSIERGGDAGFLPPPPPPPLPTHPANQLGGDCETRRAHGPLALSMTDHLLLVASSTSAGSRHPCRLALPSLPAPSSTGHGDVRPVFMFPARRDACPGDSLDLIQPYPVEPAGMNL